VCTHVDVREKGEREGGKQDKYTQREMFMDV
jgi:hypothetical protein